MKITKNFSLSTSLKIIKLLKKEFSLKCIPVGSVARGEPKNDDIDLLVYLNKLNKLNNKKTNNKKTNNKLKLNKIYLNGSRRQGWDIIYKNKHYNIDLFFIKKKELPYMLFHYIGPRSYNIRTRAYAKKKGWLLNQYGLWKNLLEKNLLEKSKNKLKRVKGTANIKTEKQLTNFLGLTYRLPNNRK